MAKKSTTIAYTTNPDITEQGLADQICAEIKNEYDSASPTGKFDVEVIVSQCIQPTKATPATVIKDKRLVPGTNEPQND